LMWLAADDAVVSFNDATCTVVVVAAGGWPHPSIQVPSALCLRAGIKTVPMSKQPLSNLVLGVLTGRGALVAGAQLRPVIAATCDDEEKGRRAAWEWFLLYEYPCWRAGRLPAAVYVEENLMACDLGIFGFNRVSSYKMLEMCETCDGWSIFGWVLVQWMLREKRVAIDVDWYPKWRRVSTINSTEQQQQKNFAFCVSFLDFGGDTTLYRSYSSDFMLFTFACAAKQR
jgi:hypothetical protein